MSTQTYYKIATWNFQETIHFFKSLVSEITTGIHSDSYNLLFPNREFFDF